jgi:hypothetical protein
MLARLAVAVAGLIAASAALAEPMGADAARRFVVGKLFTYNCFDGTRGVGRIYGDGSVAGTLQAGPTAPVKFMRLPPGTLRVKGQAVCATLRGMPFEPCFNLDRTSSHSFRGSISGLGFAYCDFDQRHARAHAVRATFRPRSKQHPPAPLQSAAAASD